MDQSSEPKKTLKPLARESQKVALAHVNDTTWYHVLSVQCDLERCDDLEEMGVLPGSKIEVLHNDHKGTLMVKIQQEMVILGRNYSYRTFVQPVKSPSRS